MDYSDIASIATKIKKKLPPDVILYLRAGDICACTGRDADLTAKIYGLRVQEHNGERFCTFAVHALDSVLERMIRAGHTTAYAANSW